ncbi:GSCOCG00012711001-RA-CDS, partial [Cotesia congregata]
YPGGRQIIRQALLNKKSPEESTEIIIASLEDSTLKQYESTYKLWWKFNQELHSDPFIVSPSKILTFLTKRFQEGASHGTINTAKAALALISQEEISNSKIITRFMKGIYKKRPKLIKKLVLLLALGTAHRIQTLAEIKISNIVQTVKGLEIKIPERIKTSRPGAVQPLLKLPFFKEKPGLCIASAVKH